MEKIEKTEKRETLIKGGETDTEGIGVFWKKSTRILERKREQREGRKKRERKKREARTET